MNVLDDLLRSLKVDGKVQSLSVCSFITAAVVEIDGRHSCGVATTLVSDFHETDLPAVREAGYLEGRRASELAELIRSSSPTEASIGMATLNALLSDQNMAETSWGEKLEFDVNASELIARVGARRRVALVGHFPFVKTLRKQVGDLWVLEKKPLDGDLPAERAGEVIPRADLLAVTGMTLVNKTFEELAALVRPSVPIIMIGPGTPLSPVLFDHGVTTVAGALVEDIDGLLAAARQGGNFRQAKKLGLRFLAISRLTDPGR